jgi:hypothetical protein
MAETVDLKEYIDSRFQTMVQASTEARTLSEQTLKRTGELLNKAEFDARHSELERRVLELSRPQYGLYLAIIAICVTVVGGGWTLVTALTDNLNRRMDAQRVEIETIQRNYLTEREFQLWREERNRSFDKKP